MDRSDKSEDSSFVVRRYSKLFVIANTKVEVVVKIDSKQIEQNEDTPVSRAQK